MKISFSKRALRALAAVSLALACSHAYAQGYPNKPVKIVVPYGPGGATDVVTRIVGTRLSEMWGQPVVIENKPGAGGNIAVVSVARSAPDGYTLLTSGASFAMNPGLYKNIPYDAEKDFFHITEIASTASILLVTPSLPVNSVKDLIELAKKNPGKITYGTAGSGTTPHLAVELFNSMAGVKMLHVPYKAEAMALQDTISGRVDVYIGSVPMFRPQMRAGKIKGLAVTTSTRSNEVPELPTVAEAGLPGYEMKGWYGAYAPANVPAEVMKKLETDFTAAIKHPDTSAKLRAAGAEPVGTTSAQFSQLVRTELKKWGAVAKSSGATVD